MSDINAEKEELNFDVTATWLHTNAIRGQIRPGVQASVQTTLKFLLVRVSCSVQYNIDW